MSTRSAISKVNPDGSITSIYCHWDGYPSYNGQMLLEHYSDESKIDELLALGDISALRPQVKPAEGQEHTFEKSQPDVVIAYGRDRAEKNVETKVHKTAKEFAKYWDDSWCEYYYQRRDGKWYYGESPSHINTELTEAAVKE